MKRIIVFLLLLATTFAGKSFAQSKQVSGIVTDEKGAVEGVTVIEKGQPQNGTTTNERGRFSLTLRGTSNTLVFTSTSYLQQEVQITGAPLAVTLATDPKGLGEVIVVGYAKQRKLTVTGSVSAISGSSIRENPSASLQNGLVGKLPGFSSQQRTGQPGSDGAAFFIRGQSSFTGSNTPLIIVDDIEYSYAQFSVIDPNEIESLSILKDAATTAVYGIKGANGVVVVTTRRGRSGSPKISFRTEYATMEPTVLPKYLDAYNTALLANQAQKNDNLYYGTSTALRWTDADLQKFQDKSDPYGHPDIDWYATLFRRYTHQTRSNIDITGGSQRVKYFVSLGYIDQGGILKNFSKDQGVNGDYFNKRFNYRSNLDINVTQNLDFRLDLFGNTSTVNNPFVNTDGSKVNAQKNDPFYEYGSYQSLAPYAYPIKNPNGSWGYSQSQKSNTAYDGNNLVERLALGGYQRNYNDNMNFIASVNEKLGFVTKGLSVKGLVSYASNYRYSRNETRANFPSYIYNPANANPYSLRDANVSRIEPFALGYDPSGTVRDLTVQVQLNYDRTFGSHHVYALSLVNRNTKIFRINFPGTTTADPTYNFIPINFQGISNRVGYDYKQKYLVEFNLGYNGTDRFQGAKRYGYFPAVSAGWNLAEEPFFKKAIPAVNLLKFKGSYGIVGSDDVGNNFGYVYIQNFFYQTTNYSGSSPGLQDFPSLRITQANFGTSSTPYTNIQEPALPNDVTWEKVKKANVGVDFALFSNKISGTIEFFRDNRYDILTKRGTVSQVLGVGLPPVNIGKVKNEGYDMEITYRNKIGKKFNYSIRGTYSYANNTRVFIDEAPPIQAYQASTGRSIGDPLLYKWTGTFYKDADDIIKSPRVTLAGVPAVHAGDLKYADMNGDGVINEFDQGFFGSPNLPRVNYGMQLQLGYGQLRFSLAFQGTGDFSIRGTEESIRAFSANLTKVHAAAWTPALGNNAKYPVLTYQRSISDPGVNSTFWARSGKYIRLRSADVSYTLPQRWIAKLGLNDIRVYANGNNLFTWSKLFDLYALDPEANSGTDRNIYPPQRVFNVGFNITF